VPEGGKRNLRTYPAAVLQHIAT